MTQKDEITLTFLGDMMCLREQISAVASARVSYDEVFSSVKHLWKDSDYVIANLETPVAPNSGRLASGPMKFNAPLDFLEAIKRAGIDFVSLANNHCLDCGILGLEETIANIRQVGLDTSGAYTREAESRELFTLKINGVPVAILPCTYGINGYDIDGLPAGEAWRVDALARGSIDGRPVSHRLLKELYARCVPSPIKRLRTAIRNEFSGRPAIEPIMDSIPPEQIGRIIDAPLEKRFQEKVARAHNGGAFVVAYPHIGGQYNPAPGKYQSYTMDWMSRAGADLIIANHAHRPLGSHWFSNGSFGAYALGNFCFTPRVGYYLNNVFADYSIVLHVKVAQSTRRISGCSFNLIKSVVRPDGVAVVKPVVEVYEETKSERIRELLRAEVSAIATMVASEEKPEVLNEYTLLIPEEGGSL